MPNSLTRRKKKTINVLRVAVRLTICHDSGYLLRPFSLPSHTPFSTPICFRSLIHAVMRLRLRVDSREIFRRLVGSIISSFVCLRRNPRNAYVSDYAYGKYSFRSFDDACDKLDEPKESLETCQKHRNY